MLKVLFLCTENACRSQMAEGLVNHDLGWQGQGLFRRGAAQPGEPPGHPGDGRVGHRYQPPARQVGG